MNFYEEALSFSEEFIKWRRKLHKVPELGINLPCTVEVVSKALDTIGIEYDIKEDISCIFAKIGSGSPCILLRADMDGLPIEEPRGLDYASTNGCMHACGHDVHAATLLCVAKLLKEHENELKGTVKLLFQSGEETFEGANAAIKEGVLNNPKVDVAFAMHAFAGYEPGEIQFGKIPMGAVYGFEMTITGKGGHGSQPERCIDPINAGVQVYLALQALIARDCPPTEEAALTIGQFSAGAAANAIPETAILKGTLRTFKPEIKNLLVRRINEIAKDVAKAYRCEFELKVLSDVPSIICDDEFSEVCINAAKKIPGVKKIKKDLHLIGSEDFAKIAEAVPSCYFVAGAGVPDESLWRGQHNPEILFNEDAIAINASVYAQVAFDYFNNNDAYPPS